ncbi:hypothetical protein YUMDRAFT_06566 [Streptomyces sp. OspMP-M45]|nr:hypothetical protein YUMDRAFT_06566 [Streptomyces sp. OspMP-M45]
MPGGCCVATPSRLPAEDTAAAQAARPASTTGADCPCARSGHHPRPVRTELGCHPEQWRRRPRGPRGRHNTAPVGLPAEGRSVTTGRRAPAPLGRAGWRPTRLAAPGRRRGPEPGDALGAQPPAGHAAEQRRPVAPGRRAHARFGRARDSRCRYGDRAKRAPLVGRARPSPPRPSPRAERTAAACALSRTQEAGRPSDPGVALPHRPAPYSLCTVPWGLSAPCLEPVRRRSPRTPPCSSPNARTPGPPWASSAPARTSSTSGSFALAPVSALLPADGILISTGEPQGERFRSAGCRRSLGQVDLAGFDQSSTQLRGFGRAAGGRERLGGVQQGAGVVADVGIVPASRTGTGE